jgi:hypothetical protein
MNYNDLLWPKKKLNKKYTYTLRTQTRKKRRVSGKTRGFWQKPDVFQTSTKMRG